MRQATHFILKLHLLLFPFYSSPHLHAVIASPPSPRPSPNNNNNNNSELNNDDIEAIAAAAQKAEALRARLQSHVEAQVNKILSEKHSQNSQNINNNNNGQKLELKIDLPPDLAALVNNEGGAALKIHQFGLHRKEESDMEEVTVTLDTSSPTSTSTTTPKTIKKQKDPLADVAKVADIIKSAEAAAKAKSASAKNDAEASSETPCDLGTHSETGFGKDGKCEVCPEGLTTRKVGSSECEVVTEEDMLAMFFDSMGGQKWSEHQRRGWKSDLPACQWGGVSCDADGRIIGIAFPEFLGMPMVKI